MMTSVEPKRRADGLDEILLPLGERAYPIRVGNACLERVGEQIRDQKAGDAALLFTNPTVDALYGGRVRSSLKAAGFELATHLMPDGEEHKNLQEYERLLSALYDFDDGRNKRLVVVNLGGGVVGDLGGFAASTYRRGIPFVQIPTTLLAMVDSAVGGKTAVNFRGAKNNVGCFSQPKLVFADGDLLKTLDARQLRAGAVEAVKYGIIRDAGFFADLEERMEDLLSLKAEVVRRVVLACYRHKAEVVLADELDTKGIRASLNLGHTFGHAIEGATRYKKYLHGEAVGIGILMAAELALSLGKITKDEKRRIALLLERMDLPLTWSGASLAAVMDSMKHDKKFTSGSPRYVIPVAIGGFELVENCSSQTIEEIFARYTA